MAKQVTFSCEMCGRQKGDTNHWWLVRESDGHGRFMTVQEWTDDNDGYEHICGEACLQKRLSQFAGAGR